MWYDVSRAASPQPVAGLILSTVYEVRADANYDVHAGEPKIPLIALRTLGGEGLLDATSQAKPFSLTAGTLLLISRGDIRRFRCARKRWHFWWFEFHPSAGLPLPLQRRLRVPSGRGETSILKACFSDLRRNAAPFQARASSRFAFLLHDWAARAPENCAPQTRHGGAIQRVIPLMYARLDASLSVPEMARVAGLGERRFRQVFAQATGRSPKRFHEELRLRKAADHLRFHAGNVSETAEVFGYSSPFHFSKAFRRFFGRPPLRYILPLETGRRRN